MTNAVNLKFFESKIYWFLSLILSFLVIYLLSSNTLHSDLSFSYQNLYSTSFNISNPLLHRQVVAGATYDVGFLYLVRFFQSIGASYYAFVFFIQMFFFASFYRFLKCFSPDYILPLSLLFYFFLQFNLGTIRQLCL